MARDLGFGGSDYPEDMEDQEVQGGGDDELEAYGFSSIRDLEEQEEADAEEPDGDEGDGDIASDVQYMGTILLGEAGVASGELLDEDTLANSDLEFGRILEAEEEEEEAVLGVDVPSRLTPREVAERKARTARKADYANVLIVDSLRKYQQEVSRYSLLTKEEEIELARRYREDGDMQAFETLVVSNLKLVIATAKRYRNRGMDFNDLIQEGNYGLIRGLEKFDYTRGTRISTYVTWWIRQCIVRGLAEKGRPVRVPVHINEKLIKINRRRGEFLKKWQREPTPEELAQLFDDHEKMTAKEVQMVLDAAKDVSSMDIRVGDDGSSAISDFIADENAPDPASELARKQVRELLLRLIHDLPDRERYIIEKKFSLEGDKGYTLEHLGKQLGITRERVRQLEAKALRMLREELSKVGADISDFVA